MRLINIDTCKLESFNEVDLPKYGILSHTWEGEEVQFSEMINDSTMDLRSKPKYHKIRGCFKLAQNDNLKYIWVDTCCIDKSSSAELQEAINSMFRWYEGAEVCYVFLSDHTPAGFIDIDLLKKCRWTTRCWTLQELIAPSIVKFYAKDWSLLGDKKNDAMTVAKATGIDFNTLESGDLSHASVAQRMSWAAKRNCTRLEDVAYSLMGLFGINMPMLYGEGDKAFVRLQEEIIRTIFDLSIFAWTDVQADSTTYRSLLAKSPADFKSCNDFFSETLFESAMPYSITNLGIHVSAMLHPLEGEEDAYIFPLTNVNEDVGEYGKQNIGIYLKRVSPQSNQFIRKNPDEIIRFNDSTDSSLAQYQELYVRQRPVIPKSHKTSYIYGFLIRIMKAEFLRRLVGFEVTVLIRRVWPPTTWSDSQKLLRIDTSAQLAAGVVWFSANGRSDILFAVVLSFKKSSGRGQIAVVDSIPSDIEESELEKSIMDVLSGRTSQVRSGSKSESSFEVWRDGLFTSISAYMHTSLFMDRVVLDVSVDVFQTFMFEK